MNVLLIGSGAREHALAWALAKSRRLGTLFCAPGNPGMKDIARTVPLAPRAHEDVLAFCRRESVSFVVIGPEAPLVAGLADALRAGGIAVFGPSQAAARLEASKGFTKDLCRDAGIPTAAYGRFANREEALAYAARRDLPIAVKADGLAAGKGVTIARTRAEAAAAIEACFSGAFGQAGLETVIEDFLKGEEASFFVLTDGETAVPLATAQDYKRAFDGDEGPNTGGMGAVSPAFALTPEAAAQAMEQIVLPTLGILRERGIPYRGVLYAGLMITSEGPKLIEYNVRFGDPECQVLLRRLDSDLLAALLATETGGIGNVDLRWRSQAAVGVVLAAKGYPGAPETGGEIRGLAAAAAVEGVEIFQAGTVFEADPGREGGGRLLVAGGRVLTVTALGADPGAARTRAYEAIGRISLPGGFYRRDIGLRTAASGRRAE